MAYLQKSASCSNEKHKYGGLTYCSMILSGWQLLAGAEGQVTDTDY